MISDTLDVDDDDNDSNGNNNVAYWREFELKGDGHGFEAEMWARRLADDSGEEGEEGERWSQDDNGNDHVRERESTVADSEDLRSSPVDATGSSSLRGSTRRRGNRRLAEVIRYDGSGSGRGSSRRTSKAVSPSVDEGVEMLDVPDATEEGNEDASDEEDEGSEHEEETDDGGRRSSKVSGRARGGRRGRGRRGRRAK